MQAEDSETSTLRDRLTEIAVAQHAGNRSPTRVSLFGAWPQWSAVPWMPSNWAGSDFATLVQKGTDFDAPGHCPDRQDFESASAQPVPSLTVRLKVRFPVIRGAVQQAPNCSAILPLRSWRRGS